MTTPSEHKYKVNRVNGTVVKDYILPIFTLIALLIGLGFFISGPQVNAESIQANADAIEVTRQTIKEGFEKSGEQIIQLRLAVSELTLLNSTAARERNKLEQKLDELEKELKEIIRNGNGG